MRGEGSSMIPFSLRNGLIAGHLNLEAYFHHEIEPVDAIHGDTDIHVSWANAQTVTWTGT